MLHATNVFTLQGLIAMGKILYFVTFPPRTWLSTAWRYLAWMFALGFLGLPAALRESALAQVPAATAGASPPTAASAAGRGGEAQAGWPAEVREVRYPSQADHTLQPALFYDPGGDAAKPLLVALHSWSGDYRQANPAYGLWCIAKGWVMVHPDFRGVNLSAVEYAKATSRIDEQRIYLMGGSGGGYASLLMAGRAPEVWAGVSAWCPIFDLTAWHAETQSRKLRYATMLEKVCGGPPGTSPEVDEQYRRRSASAWLAQAAPVNLSINAGITDGHNGSVPVSHSLEAFNTLARETERISAETIAALVAAPEVPDILRQTLADPLFPRQPVLFRRTSQRVQVSLFQGGHEILYEAGLAWLEQQRRGAPPVWEVTALPAIDWKRVDTQSGK
jgi:pimeloyl-ACP methyl ester carboxylesterase